MKTKLRTFDGYVGIEIEVDSKRYRHGHENFDHGILFITTKWCRVSKSKGRMRAHWDELEKIWVGPQCLRFIKIPRAFEHHDAMVMFVQEMLNEQLDIVEESLCKAGKCQINARHCPERKVS